MSDNILVFRKRLLAYSETFIAAQGLFLPTMRAWFVGFRRDPSGIEMLPENRRILQSDHANWPAARLRMRTGLGVDSGFLGALGSTSPGLIHAHFGGSGVAALPIASALGIPLVVTFHGHDITKDEPRSLYGKARPALFRDADRIIAVSDYIRSRLLDRGCPDHKIVRHYIGIDTRHFSAEKTEAATPTILFVGRLVEKKGCTYLLQALRRVQRVMPEAELRIVGDGALRSTLEAEAADLNNVTFVGVLDRNQVREELRRAWVYCSLSIIADGGDAEGLGMVFLEAQALATPAISFAAGGAVEAIADGETGYLLPPKDVEALARAILGLLQDPERRRRFGAAGVRRVREQFDIRSQCEALEAIYRDVIDERERVGAQGRAPEG